MSWAHYILQVNIYLLVFYGFYKLLLDKETYFTLNRIYLVSAGVLSLAIPFLRFEWFTKQAVVQPVYVSVGQLMGQVSIVEDTSTSFNTGNLIVFIYLIGVIFFAFRFIFKLWSVNRKLKLQEIGDAFSFFRTKRIGSNLPHSKTVHQHEDTHIRQWHSIDVLFFEVLNIFTWFNPVIYFYKNSVKNIHEYLADDEAARFQGDKDEYALLLLSTAFGVPVNTLTNNFFNKSLIKKRIFMLHKQRSRKVAILKYGLFIPLFGVALMLSSATIQNNEKIQSIADNIPLNTPIEAVNEVVTASIDPIAPQLLKRTQSNLQESGQKREGWDLVYALLKTRLKYPSAAQNDRIQGTSMVKFTIVGGQIETLGVATKLGGGCDAEVMRCLTSITYYKMVKDGKYTLKVKFALTEAKTPELNQNIAPLKGYTALNEITIVGYGGPDSEDKVYDFVSIETQPSFSGGMAKFYQYLNKSIKYPAEAFNNKVEGKVFLSFIVEKNGALNDIKVERRLGYGTDEEAVRVLKASPRWVAGIQKGKPVRVKYNIPISFNLNKTSSGSDSTIKKGPQSLNIIGIRFKDNTGAEMKQANEPLVILDGEPSDMAATKTISPDKIESINILKDAKATALYGSKAIHGVIIITTKKAKTLEKGAEKQETKE